jgi:hypothetical protein
MTTKLDLQSKESPGADAMSEGDPIAAHAASGGQNFTVVVKVARCRAFGMKPISLDDVDHPFVRAALAIVDGRSRDDAMDSLSRYYVGFRPTHAAAVVGLSDYHLLSGHPPLAAILPWDAFSPADQLAYMTGCIEGFYRSRKIPLEVADGHAHFGPVSPRKCELEIRRLIEVYDSINRFGFDTARGSILASVIIDDRSSEWACQITDGLHRIAVLRALGTVSVPICVLAGDAAVVRRSEVDRWPQVVGGIFSRVEALSVFDAMLQG